MKQPALRIDWDRGNRDECQKHGMSIKDIEAVFRGPAVISPRQGKPQERAPAESNWNHSVRFMHGKEVEGYEEAHPDIQNQ